MRLRNNKVWKVEMLRASVRDVVPAWRVTTASFIGVLGRDHDELVCFGSIR